MFSHVRGREYHVHRGGDKPALVKERLFAEVFDVLSAVLAEGDDLPSPKLRAKRSGSARGLVGSGPLRYTLIAGSNTRQSRDQTTGGVETKTMSGTDSLTTAQ